MYAAAAGVHGTLLDGNLFLYVEKVHSKIATKIQYSKSITTHSHVLARATC